MNRKNIYKIFIKRLMDIILSIFALLILSPLMIFLAFIIRLKLGSPILFKQRRPGKDGKIFVMYKYRTMLNTRNDNGILLSDNDRLTKFGKILRSTSLDELPELFNIIKGDMSIVGPRPQLIKDLLFMSEEVKCRHILRPGLTGYAQIMGRNEISWDEKFKYDLIYIDNISLFLDIKIIFITIFKVINRVGISSTDCDTSLDYGDFLLKEKRISEEYYNEKLKFIEMYK